MAKRKRKFIQTAIRRPGALRAAARRRGLLKGSDDTLSLSDTAKLQAAARRSGNTRLLRQANLAETLIKRSRRRKSKRS